MVGDANLGFQLHWGGQVTLAPASWQKEGDQTPHPLLRVKKQSSMCIRIKGLNQSQCCLGPAWGRGGVRAGQASAFLKSIQGTLMVKQVENQYLKPFAK